jgi:hypothetical protein
MNLAARTLPERSTRGASTMLLIVLTACGASEPSSSGRSSSGAEAIPDGSALGSETALVDAPADAGFPPPPPIDPNTPVDMLTTAQKGALCDWQYAGTGENYGEVLDCGDAGREFLAIRVDCIDVEFSLCPNVTVAQFEACVNVLFLTHGCGFLLNVPECAPLREVDYDCPDGSFRSDQPYGGPILPEQ